MPAWTILLGPCKHRFYDAAAVATRSVVPPANVTGHVKMD